MLLGLAIGDPTGIGPEVTLKALAAEAANDDVRYRLIGDALMLQRLNARLGLNLPLAEVDESSSRFLITNPLRDPLPENLSPGAPAAANAALAWLKHAGELCLRGELDAMVTAPVNKEAIVRAGNSFVGQTEFLTELAGASRTVMMLLGHDERGRWLRKVGISASSAGA